MSELYVFDKLNNRYEAMSKEQVLAAIAQAVATGEIKDVDAGFVTTVKEQNKATGLKFWVGTQAEYNAIAEKETNCFYIVTDDTFGDDVNKAVEEMQNDIKAFAEEIKTFEQEFKTEFGEIAPKEGWLNVMETRATGPVSVGSLYYYTQGAITHIVGTLSLTPNSSGVATETRKLFFDNSSFFAGNVRTKYMNAITRHSSLSQVGDFTEPWVIEYDGYNGASIEMNGYTHGAIRIKDLPVTDITSHDIYINIMFVARGLG